jgi:outer membrane protein assembly factor BamB
VKSLVSFLILISVFTISTRGVTNDALLSQPLTVRWRYESNVTNLTPAFDNERIYIPIAGGQLVALKAKDGQLFWRAEIGGELSASPVADENAIYVASETLVKGDGQKSSGALRALGREGGVTQWMTPLVRPLRGALALSHGKIFA